MNNTTNVTCPKCGAQFSLTDAVSHAIRETAGTMVCSEKAVCYLV